MKINSSLGAVRHRFSIVTVPKEELRPVQGRACGIILMALVYLMQDERLTGDKSSSHVNLRSSSHLYFITVSCINYYLLSVTLTIPLQYPFRDKQDSNYIASLWRFIGRCIPVYTWTFPATLGGSNEFQHKVPMSLGKFLIVVSC